MLIYRGFIGQIDYDDKSKLLVGEIINCTDILEFSGQTAVEIKTDFQRCIDEYLVFQKDVNGDIPLPFIGHFTVQLTTDKQDKVIKAAHKNGQTVSHWLNHLVDSHLSQYFDKTA